MEKERLSDREERVSDIEEEGVSDGEEEGVMERMLLEGCPPHFSSCRAAVL